MAYETVYNNINERLPILTNASHCARAMSFFEQGNIYIGLGKTTPWEGEDEDGFIPPEPDVNAINLTELIGVKKVNRVVMVMPSEDGEVEYATQRFKTLTKEEAFKQKSRWVLIESTIEFVELPPVSYRQIGIFSRLTPNDGLNDQKVLLPNEIKDIGILEVINNRKAVTRQSDTRDSYRMIIEF